MESASQAEEAVVVVAVVVVGEADAVAAVDAADARSVRFEWGKPAYDENIIVMQVAVQPHYKSDETPCPQTAWKQILEEVQYWSINIF